MQARISVGDEARLGGDIAGSGEYDFFGRNGVVDAEVVAEVLRYLVEGVGKLSSEVVAGVGRALFSDEGVVVNGFLEVEGEKAEGLE